MVITRERNIKKFTILGRKPWNFKSVVASAVYVHLVLAIVIISCLINIDRQIRFEYIFSLRFPGFYSSLGCFSDNDQDRAVPTMEGTHQLLKGSFLTRKDAVEKCAEVTRSRGWKVFAVQDGGWCASSPTAHLTYNKYGTAVNCVDGKGGMFANDVYIINGKIYLRLRLSNGRSIKVSGHNSIVSKHLIRIKPSEFISPNWVVWNNKKAFYFR